MQASNFQDTSFDVMDVTPADESLDMTGMSSPSGGGQTSVSDSPLTAPVSGPSSSLGSEKPLAPVSLPDSDKVGAEEEKDLFASLSSDPRFNLLLKTSSAQNQLDYEDVTAGTKTPEELPEHSPIRAALLLAKRTNGKNALQTRNEAEKLGIPVGMAMASPETVRNEFYAREIEKNLLFAKWASKSKENAAIAREDAAGLGKIFSDLVDFATHPDEWGRSILHWTTQSKNSPVATAHREIERTVQALGHGVTEVGKSFWGGLQMLADHPAFGGPDSMFATALRDARKQSETIEMPKALSDVSGFAQKADQFWLDAVSAIPGMAAAMMATVGTGGVAGPEIGALAGMGVMGHQIAGGDYLKYTEEEGISRERARAAAIFNAAMQAPLENLGQLMFLKAFSSKGYKKIFENWLKAGGAEGVEEYFQKWPEFMANIYAESEKHGATAAEQDAWSWGQLTDTANLLKTHQEGLYEAAIGAFLGLLGGSAHLSIEGARLNRAQEFAGMHKKFHEALVGNQTAVDSPATMAEILMENNPEMQRVVHISADELYQLAGKDNTLLASLGIEEAKLKQDAADGQFYEVPVGVLHARLNDKAQFESVFDIARENEDAYTAKEGGDEKFRQEIQDRDVATIQKQLQNNVELFQKRERDEGAIKEQRLRLHQELTQAILNVPSARKQAKAYGGVDKFVNDHLMTMEREARRIAQTSDYRMSASELLRAISFQGLNITRYLGDDFNWENFVPKKKGRTVTQEIQSEFEESRIRREFEEANRSDFFDNIETTAPVSDFQTAADIFRANEWGETSLTESTDNVTGKDTKNASGVPVETPNVETQGKSGKGKKRRSKAQTPAKKPAIYQNVDAEKADFRGEEVPLFADGTVLRLPGGTVTAPFQYDPDKRKEGQTEREARAQQGYDWMRQAVAQMGSEAVAENDGSIETMERLLEDGPEVSDIAYRPDRERARADRKTDGKTAEGHVAGSDGWLHTRESDDAIRYELWELDDLNVSHDPLNNFDKNPLYPAGVQDRPYHQDDAEKNKVRLHASGLRPDMIITDNPDMVNGPTIVALDGDVLGGNSRAMTMQLVYEYYPENADKYLKMLMDKATTFGFTSDDVAKFKRPVLVRVVQQQLTNEEKAHKATLYNETPTQELGKIAEGVARGKLLTEQSLSILVNRYAEGGYVSLRDFLRHADAKPFVDSIIKDGVIKDTELGKYLEDDGSLSSRGQDLVEDALCGYVVPNTDVVQNLRDRSRRDYNHLLRVLPYLAICKKKGGNWDVTDQLTDSLRLLSKQGSLEENLNTNSLIDNGKPTPISVEAMARSLHGKETEMVAHFATFAKLATQKVNPLMGVNANLDAATAFEEAFLKDVAVVDGQSVVHFDKNSAAGRAYDYAVQNGGRGHRASVALQALEEEMDDARLSEEERENLKEIQGVLTKVKGRVDVYGPVEISRLKNREIFQTGGQPLVREGIKRKPDSATAQVIEIPKNVVPEFDDIKQFANWLKDTLASGENITIKSTGDVVRFTRSKVDASAKRSRSKEHRNAYAGLRKLVENAEYDHYERPDARHPDSGGQDVYHAALRMGGKLYSVRLKFDVVTERQAQTDKSKGQNQGENIRYKDHKLTEIEIAPTLYRSTAQTGGTTQEVSAIDRVTLGVLRENVKPSGIAGNILYQQGGNIFGSTQIMSDNTYLVTLFQGANLSSIIHETAHVWFEELERVTQMEGCPEELRADFAKLRGWVGAEEATPLNVDQKEQLARGMEAYMREGKAPAEELTSIFSRFKKWLTKIYQSVLSLNVHLTDEVRQVFDRMLATEEEIKEVYRENEIATRTEEIADSLGLTGADRKAYLGAAQGVADAAEYKLTRERNANIRQRRRQYTAEAKAAVQGDKLYDLVDGLKGRPLDLDDLKANFGQDVVNVLRARNSGWIKRGSGVVAEELASEYGYDSAEEMVNDLKDRGMSRRKAISDYVKDKIAEYDEQHAAEDYIEDNEKIIGHLEMEGQYVAKQVGKENVPRNMIRAAALQRLSRERVFYAVQANKYRNAYRRAISAERRAILKGDFDSALLYNYQARLNFELAAMSRDLRKEMLALRKGMRKFVDNRKYDPRARFAVMALASQHGIMPWNERLADGKDASTFEEWNRDVGERGYWAEVPFADMWQGESESLFTNRAEYMTVEDYTSLTHFLKNIVQIERNMHTEVKAAQGANLDELAQNLADTVYANRETVPVNTFERDSLLRAGFKSMHASHSKIEVLCEALDGKPLGPLWQAIYAPINEAEDNQTRRLRKMRDDMKRLFSVYSQKELAKYMVSKQYEDAVKASLTMQQRIMVALNMGNEQNLDRLRTGHNITDSQIAAIVKPLTERDWRFVESVWEYLDTFRDEAFQLEEDVNGLKPERVEAQPFTVTTSDGKTMNIKGGYFPIRYANEKENPVYVPEMKLNDAIVNGLGYASLQTKQGHLKQRAPRRKDATPLNLSFDVIADHVFNMIHDICYRRAVLDVAKVVQHHTLRDAFANTDGMHLYKLFLPWLQDCANEKVSMIPWIDPAARWARSATTTMMMGLKFTTMFTQPVGITQSAHVLGGWKNIYRGLRSLDPRKTAEMYHEACARSAFMEARMMNYDRDVRDMLKQINAGVGFQKLLNTARSTAFTPMGWFQMYFVDLPTWWAGYEKGIKDYAGDEKKAVAYADHVVRISQGSGATKDLARVQRGHEISRLFTMFYSYFNTLYNVAALHADWAKKHHSPAEVWLTFCAAMNLWFVPAILSELVAGRGPDDDDDPWFWATKQWCGYPLQTIVLLRELGNALFGEYGYKITPAEMAPKSIYNWVTAVKQAYEGKGSGERVGEKTAEMGGYILRLPMKQIITNTTNFYDWMSGESEFRIRDLFFPKRKNESRRGQ